MIKEKVLLQLRHVTCDIYLPKYIYSVSKVSSYVRATQFPVISCWLSCSLTFAFYTHLTRQMHMLDVVFTCSLALVYGVFHHVFFFFFWLIVDCMSNVFSWGSCVLFMSASLSPLIVLAIKVACCKRGWTLYGGHRCAGLLELLEKNKNKKQLPLCT